MRHDDPLSGLETEEAVLSSMMSGRRVGSLEPEHFTSPIRQVMYRMLRSGVPYDTLEAELRREGFKEEELYYVGDVYLVPMLPHRAMVDAVGELKRLALLRPLVAAVDLWRLKAPHLSFEVAVRELGRAIRRS